MHEELISVPGRKHPMQVLVAGLLVIAGLAVLLGGPRPGSMGALLPLPFLMVWAAVLVVCESMVVAAAIVKPTRAIFLESVAHLPLAIMLAVYALSVLTVAGGRGLVVELIVTAIAAAHAIREWQVLRVIRKLPRRPR